MNSKTLCNSASESGYHKPLFAGANPTAADVGVGGVESRRLASGAEVGAAVLHRDPLDGAATNEEVFASH